MTQPRPRAVRVRTIRGSVAEAEMRGLAYRRHQWQRAKGRAARYLRWVFAAGRRWVTRKKIARYAVDRTPCSCPMCGNPRRWTGEPTRQELRASCHCEEPEAEPIAAADGGA